MTNPVVLLINVNMFFFSWEKILNFFSRWLMMNEPLSRHAPLQLLYTPVINSGCLWLKALRSGRWDLNRAGLAAGEPLLKIPTPFFIYIRRVGYCGWVGIQTSLIDCFQLFSILFPQKYKNEKEVTCVF